MNYFILLIVVLIFLLPPTLYAADSNTVSSSTVTGTTTVDRTPSTAASPNVIINNQDVCTTGISGAAQSAWFGISMGKTIRDENCERLKLARSLYGMGMKVASVSLMCQDTRVFQAMEMAGTPCPYMGKIGNEASEAWQANAQERPDYKDNKRKINKRQDRIEDEKEILEAKEKAEAERPKKEFLEACIGSRHTVESAAASGNKRAKEGVKKSSSTCRTEWRSLNN